MLSGARWAVVQEPRGRQRTQRMSPWVPVAPTLTHQEPPYQVTAAPSSPCGDPRGRMSPSRLGLTWEGCEEGILLPGSLPARPPELALPLPRPALAQLPSQVLALNTHPMPQHLSQRLLLRPWPATQCQEYGSWFRRPGPASLCFSDLKQPENLLVTFRPRDGSWPPGGKPEQRRHFRGKPGKDDRVPGPRR